MALDKEPTIAAMANPNMHVWDLCTRVLDMCVYLPTYLPAYLPAYLVTHLQDGTHTNTLQPT